MAAADGKGVIDGEASFEPLRTEGGRGSVESSLVKGAKAKRAETDRGGGRGSGSEGGGVATAERVGGQGLHKYLGVIN